MGVYVKVYSDELAHHGIKGMKWGVRRYQTKDGGLTAAGRKRYSDSEIGNRLKATGHKIAAKNYELNEKTYSKMGSKQAKTIAGMNRSAKNAAYKKAAQYQEQADKIKAQKQADKEAKAEFYKTPEGKKELQKKAIKVGAAVAGTALAAYGAKKVYDVAKEKKAVEGRRRVEKLKFEAADKSYKALLESLNSDAGKAMTSARQYDDFGFYEYINDGIKKTITRHDY